MVFRTLKGRKMVDTSASAYGEKVIDDTIVDRNRMANAVVFLTTTALVQAIPTVGLGMLTSSLFGTAVPLPMGLVGGIIGFTGGLIANVEVLKRSLVNNEVAQAFVTVDSLKAILGRKNPFVVYGPGGPYLAKWWEQRSGENVINLEIASVNFSFTVQCADGVLYGEGSFRLRADIRHAVKYLRGYNAIAEDIGELIIAHAITELANKRARSATHHIKALNESLTQKFAGMGSDTTNFEEGYGVNFIDVTVTKLMPSEDLQKTMSAIAEASMVKAGTAALLGMSQKAVAAALEAGTLSRADYNNARDRFLSVSGNLEGMDISRQEFEINLKGIEPQSLKDLLLLARNAGLLGKKGGS